MEAFVIMNPKLEYVQKYDRDTDHLVMTEELEKALLCETSLEAMFAAKEIMVKTPYKIMQVVRVHV